MSPVRARPKRQPQFQTYLAFVSYKGGVGRSLAAASCANALARGGSHVLLIDFDIDAPSLPAFYGYDSFAQVRPRLAKFKGTILERTGLVSWAVDRQEDSKDLLPTTPFDRHLIPIDIEGGGSLRMLPAGPVGEQMLHDLGHYRWQAWMRPRETERPWAKTMTDELKDSIAGLDPPVKFVLVDATAGLDPAAYRVLTDLADHAVFLLTNEPGEKVVADDIDRLFALGQFHVVHSRVPTQLEEAEKFLDYSDYKGERLPILRYDPVYGLQALAPSVPTIGGFHDPSFKRTSTSPHQLTLDHLRLLARVLTPDTLQECVTDPTVSDWLAMALAEEDPAEFYKLFKLASGTIFNPSDPDYAANVSFRVSSISRIFNDVWSGLDPESKRDKAFQTAGRNAGEGYGRSLRESMAHPELDVRAMLRRWCREDSHVGFGDQNLLEFDPLFNRGEIMVRHVFLPRERLSNGEMLEGGSWIFEGYVAGVLQGLLGDDMNVDVIWMDGDTPSPTGTSALVRFGPTQASDPPS